MSGLFWRFMERCGAQLVSFVVSLVLARLLAPEAYGTIALVTVFTSILQIFVDSGMGTALVQKKDADQLDFSSVFYFNIVMCLFIYMILFVCAPAIAGFYNRPELVPLVRVLSLTVVISALKNVQQAYVSKHMLFKRFFFATLGGTLGAAVLGIIMAMNGFGVWALVAQQLFNTTVDTLILWMTVKWRPTREFSFTRLKGLLSFGWKLLASSLLNTVYNNLRSLVIGKLYSADDLAFYDKGKSFPHLVVNNVNTSIDSVLLPAMASAQDNVETVKRMTRRAITVSSCIMWPIMIGLAVTAKPMIVMLITDKWLPAVPFLQIACISFALEPLQTANLNAIKAMGRSDIFFKLEILKKSVSIAILLLSMRYGVIAIAISSAVYSFIATMFNASPNRKLLNYSYFEQLRDIMPSILCSLIMGALIYPLTFLHISNALIILMQFVAGMGIYFLLMIVTKSEAFAYIVSTFKHLVLKR